ncbi:hypothetical protein TCSYLVIO_006658 [Trypanosoma cruzi]|nr:hypothetical protein TCSYLVIO_006658 [Trypanosoma cruzi]
MRRANEVAREMWAPSTWEPRMSLAERFKTLCRTHERTMNEESCAAFLMAIGVAPSTRLQYARMLRSMLEMYLTPLGMMILGLQKIAARSETKQARPLTEEEMNQVIYSRTDWKESVVFRLAWITTIRWSEIAALTVKNFTLKPDGTLILDWSVAPKTARADLHRASRFVRIRGQDTSRERKAHASYDRPSQKSSGSLECHGAFHKTRCVEARCSNRGDAQFGPTRDFAVGEARRPVRPSPEYCLIFVEVHHSADPGVVAGRIDVKGETAAGQEPWLRAEERFSVILITIMLLQ